MPRQAARSGRQKDDPRVTRVGRFIRKVRIDELPQAWSVLKGEMSFVGPRPERPEFVSDLEKQLPYYAERHMVKPGITGWAQINYPYGASIEDSRHKLEYDLYYAKNYTPFLDLLILLQTLRVVLWHEGSALMHLLVAIGGLVLTHNLYGGASQQARLVLRWPAASLALIWVVDLNHSAIAFLSEDIPQVTAALRGLLGVPVAGLLMLGAGERSEELRFRPSRAVAFQSVSLALIGAYLIAMVAAAQWLAYAGSNYSVLLQVAFVTTASLAALALATSKRLRGWLRVTVIKHLFQLRYDYRAEWLRLNRTIGQAGPEGAPLGERVIRSLADIAECPAGLLLTCGDGGELAIASRWQWPTADVPMVAIDAATSRTFERDGFIADLDQLRQIADPLHPVPEWIKADPKAWALVPLLHYDRLVGMVVLARPPMPRRLRLGRLRPAARRRRQLASYLAENAGQEALAEASRFDDFHRRIAFVMHDIKNLASQLSLLARNAELHAENPEFPRRHAGDAAQFDRQAQCAARALSRYGATAIEGLVPDPCRRWSPKRWSNSLAGLHPVTLVEAQPCEVMAAERFA
jgi:hypothetical protein